MLLCLLLSRLERRNEWHADVLNMTKLQYKRGRVLELHAHGRGGHKLRQVVL